MRRIPGPVVLLLLALIPLAPCAKKKPPKCKFDGQTTLGTFPWPRFRSDMDNTGSTDTSVAETNVGMKWCYPLGTPVTIESSPVVGMGQIYFGASDGSFHVLNSADGVPNDTFTNNLATGITIKAAITSTALLGANGNVFFATGAGQVLQTDSTGKLLHLSTLSGFLGSSPNIAPDGEVFIGSEGGSFSSVCPNGIPRYSALIAPTASTAGAASQNFCMNFYGNPNSQTCPRAFVGASDNQLSSFDMLGRQHWAFFASAPILTSVVLQEQESNTATEQFNRAFVVDSSGKLFVVSMNLGCRLSAPLTLPGPVTASPALLGWMVDGGPSTIYVADQTGVLTAVDVETVDQSPETTCPPGESVQLSARTVFTAGGAINSSPALSAPSGSPPVIVFGADDGFVYAVMDDGATCVDGTCDGGPNDGEACTTDDECVLLWRFDTGSRIGTSSPAIDSDGTVYIGTQGGNLFALGDNGSPDNTCVLAATPTPVATETPTP